MKQKSNAFTLIELMVVIAIIGILAAVITVSMSQYGKKAKAAAALQVAHGVLPAAMDCNLRGQNFTGAWNGYICNGSSVTWPSLGYSSTSGWYWGNFSGSDEYYMTDGTQYIFCRTNVDAWGWDGRIGVQLAPGSCSLYPY